MASAFLLGDGALGHGSLKVESTQAAAVYM